MHMPVAARNDVSGSLLGIVTPVRTPHISVSSVTVRNPSPAVLHEKVHEKFTIFLPDSDIIQWQGGQSTLTNLDTLHPDRQTYPTFSQLDDPCSHFRHVENEMRVLVCNAAAKEAREQPPGPLI
jgi:hypothetical protein